MGSIALSIAKRFAERQALASASRADLRLTDFRAINGGSAYKIAVSFDKNLPQPSPKDVRSFVTQITKGGLIPKMATARAHTEGRHHGISLIASPQRLIRKIEHKKNLKEVIANTMFLDTEMNETWKVQTDDNGKKYLECTRQEDIEKLLKVATASATNKVDGLRLGSTVVGGASLPEKGDVVKFYSSNAQRTGSVTKIKGDEVYIAEDDGNTHIVSVNSIIDILKKNAKSEQEALNETASFYATYLPKDFVRELFPGAKV